jgi:putative sterol carrier protein
MNRTPKVKEFASGWESQIQFDLSGEEPFGLVFSKEGSVSFKEGRLSAPDVTFYCSSNLFFDLITGRTSQDDAFANGLVEIRGSIYDSVRFRHAAEITQEQHRTLFSVLRALSRFA